MTPGAMETERWRRLEALFHRARGLEGEERSRFLEDACAGDLELRRELRSLLSHATDSRTRLARVIEEASAAADGADLAPRVGQRLGAYRLLEVLGRGGLGAVYLAERADSQFELRVAIKVIRVEIEEGGELAERLRQERQILATLDHPNIGRLLDGGTTDDGLPYFVMEHIEGVDLETYCRRHRLGLRRRLELFLQLCGAVAHAHSRLIIHRDLKPANILIAGDGTLKLIDFGIAKIHAGALLPPERAPTEPGRQLLTLAFASPEQLAGETLGTATDVYSLGVVLYRLLAGAHPHDLDGLERDQVLAKIERLEAPPPSRRAGDGEAIAPAQIEGDLDLLVLMAIHRDPGRRYASVQRLADDVESYLEGRPIAARGDSWAYRARRFLVRRRWPVTAAATVALLSVFYTVRLAAERDLARREATSKTTIAELMVDLFQGARPDRAGDREVSARELLDRGAQNLRRELAGEPAIRAEMLAVIGRAYGELGLAEQATPLLEEALDVRLRQDPQDPAAVAASRNLLGEHLVGLGRLEEAESLFRAALESRRRELGETHLDTLTSLNNLAVTLGYSGRLEQAEARMRRVLELRQEHHPQQLGEIATGFNNLADLLDRQGRGDEAESAYLAALDLKVQATGELSTGVALIHNNLGRLAETRGERLAARSHFRRALDLNRRLLSPSHPDIAYGLSRLATIAEGEGDARLAERYWLECLDLELADNRASRALRAGALESLARLRIDGGRPREAEQLIAEALRLRLARYGDQHPRVARLRVLEALTLAAEGRGEEAARQLETALEALHGEPGAQHPDARWARERLAALRGGTAGP